jgi:threonine dehydrogenase-like Zn-dependent dehydrogenase
MPELPWNSVIDCSNAASLPAKALDLVEPAGHVVYVGLAGSPSVIDTRTLVLKDVTATGILGASQALDGAIDAFATGAVDPRPLVAATVTLEDVAAALSGERLPESGAGPKVHVRVSGGSPSEGSSR